MQEDTPPSPSGSISHAPAEHSTTACSIGCAETSRILSKSHGSPALPPHLTCNVTIVMIEKYYDNNCTLEFVDALRVRSVDSGAVLWKICQHVLRGVEKPSMSFVELSRKRRSKVPTRTECPRSIAQCRRSVYIWLPDIGSPSVISKADPTRPAVAASVERKHRSILAQQVQLTRLRPIRVWLR